MITYAERMCFDDHHLRALSAVTALVSRVSSSWGNELRCHELARAIRICAPEHALAVVDGKCGPIEHSWLCFSDGVILDPYAPGRMPAVQILDPIVGTAYRPSAPRSDIRQDVIDLLVLEIRGDV